MRVYTPYYSSHAGKWIYKGIRSAWNKLGYDVYESSPADRKALRVEAPIPALNDAEGTIIMTTD